MDTVVGKEEKKNYLLLFLLVDLIRFHIVTHFYQGNHLSDDHEQIEHFHTHTHCIELIQFESHWN